MDTQTHRTAYEASTEVPARQGNLALRRLIAIGVTLGILVLGFAGFGFLASTGKKPPKNTDAPAPLAVEMGTAVRESTSARVQSTGEVRPRTSTELSARASGQVTWVSPRLEAGAEVRSGERLIQIDPANYRLALETVEADAARARETLTRVKAEAELAARDYAELGLEDAPSDLALGRPQIATAEANLRAVEARIEESRLQLSRTTILAPYSGRVQGRNVDVGDFVTMGMPVTALFSTDVAQIRVPLTDADLKTLALYPGFTPTAQKPAPIAAIEADIAGTKAKFTGKLVAVDAAVDATTRQTFALVEVEKPFGDTSGTPLAPGVFATVSLEGQTAVSLIKVPRGALKKGAEIYAVRADDTLEIRPVSPVQSDADYVWLASGIEDGERVIISFVPSARTGLAVRDRAAPEPPKEAEVVTDAKKTKDEKKKKAER